MFKEKRETRKFGVSSNYYRRNCLEMSCKKGVFKDFVQFTEKYQY